MIPVANSGDVGYCLTASAQQSLDAETETLIATAAAPAITSNPYGDHESREGLLVAHPIAFEANMSLQDPDDSGVHPTITRRTHAAVAQPIVLMERGLGDGPNLETRQDGTANAILTPNGGRGGLGVGAVAFAENSRGELRLQGGDGAIAPQLTTGGGKPGQGQPCVAEAWAVRRLTPVECARLQGFPDDYLPSVIYRGKPPADGPMYKALGNSMAVSVMRCIGTRIAMVDAQISAEQAA
jgi:DNA (cytosine-5)-methyltransferase 1